jgi:hypothetical protein
MTGVATRRRVDPGRPMRRITPSTCDPAVRVHASDQPAASQLCNGIATAAVRGQTPPYAAAIDQTVATRVESLRGAVVTQLRVDNAFTLAFDSEPPNLLRIEGGFHLSGSCRRRTPFRRRVPANRPRLHARPGRGDRCRGRDLARRRADARVRERRTDSRPRDHAVRGVDAVGARSGHSRIAARRRSACPTVEGVRLVTAVELPTPAVASLQRECNGRRSGSDPGARPGIGAWPRAAGPGSSPPASRQVLVASRCISRSWWRKPKRS